MNLVGRLRILKLQFPFSIPYKPELSKVRSDNLHSQAEIPIDTLESLHWSGGGRNGLVLASHFGEVE